MSSAERNDYNIEILSGDDLVERVSALFEKNGESKSTEHLKWQYLDSPAGAGYTAVAVSGDGEDAAAYSVFQVRGEFRGEKVTLVQSIDTLTDRQHRGRGLFPKLSKAVYKACDDDRVFCVYGFPNSNSAPGFFGKLEWNSFGYPPFQFHLCNLLFPLSYVLKKDLPRLPNAIACWLIKSRLRRQSKRSGMSIAAGVDFNSDEYALLWEKFSQLPGLKVCRDGQYMAWRYKEKPGNLYEYTSIRGPDKTLLGVIVTRLVKKHGGNIGYIMDIVADPNELSAARILALASISRFYDRGADMVLAWSPKWSSLRSAYKGASFFPMPRRLQPIKLHFGARPLDPESNRVNADDFFVSYSDSDTV